MIVSVAAIGCAIGLAACGSGDATSTTPSGQLKLKLEQPSQPLAEEGTSTGFRLMRDGEEAYSGDFWRLPRGRENEAAGTTTYDLDTVDLDDGDYGMEAVVKTCGAAGCSDADLGSPSTSCDAHVQIHPGAVTVLTVVVRGLNRPCAFTVTPG